MGIMSLGKNIAKDMTIGIHTSFLYLIIRFLLNKEPRLTNKTKNDVISTNTMSSNRRHWNEDEPQANGRKSNIEMSVIDKNIIKSRPRTAETIQKSLSSFIT